MVTITFDTPKSVDALEAEGRQLATKADLREMELRLEAKLEANKDELLKWMFGAMVAQTGVIVALLKLLP